MCAYTRSQFSNRLDDRRDGELSARMSQTLTMHGRDSMDIPVAHFDGPAYREAADRAGQKRRGEVVYKAPQVDSRLDDDYPGL